MESEGEGNVPSFPGQINGGTQKEQWHMDTFGDVGDHEVCFGNVEVFVLYGLMDTYRS